MRGEGERVCVLVWDTRLGSAIMNLDRGAPVEALVIFSDGGEREVHTQHNTQLL